MSAKLRWGILGPGGIASQFAEDLQLDGFPIAAVGSRQLNCARAFAAHFGITHAHGSYQDLVLNEEVDAIYVATPHPFHEPHAKLAIAAGKHVLVEKPFALNSGEAASVLEAARVAGVVALEGMWTRYLPHMRRLREVIAAGTIGEVRTVVADHGQSLSTDPSHRANNPALGGGSLLDLGVYPVSFAIDILGLPTHVVASGSLTATGVDRQVAITMEHANFAQSFSHSALDATGPVRAWITGTHGRIEIDRVWYAPTGFTVFDQNNAVIEHYSNDVAPHGMQYEAREMQRCVDGGLTESPLLPRDQIIAVMNVLDDVRQQIGVSYPGE